MKIATQDSLIHELKRLSAKAGSQTALAHKLGISPTYLSYMLRGVHPISEGVAKWLGYQRRMVYVKLGENE
ncbi:MAG: helix-turn-helix domain-containing protein [Gammaproteobacteria bacterium]